jgi:hypothetical protein
MNRSRLPLPVLRRMIPPPSNLWNLQRRWDLPTLLKVLVGLTWCFNYDIDNILAFVVYLSS